jgi:hypothetical protein
MKLTKMFSQNGKQLLVLKNFKFKFKYNSKISGYSTWISSKKTCRAKLVLNNENNILQEKSFFVDNHESDPTIERQAVSNTI